MNFASVVERLQTLENPYPGLRPFETEESHLFFGRDAQVAELVGRLERNRFVAVLGVSGSGKSSLVRAGLIPALERGRISEAGQRWRMVVTRPGSAPFTCLAADLARAGLDASRLADSSHGLIEIARQLPPDESLLVVVDQFEELFRYKDLAFVNEEARRRHDTLAAEASEFVQLILAAGRHQPPVYIVLTMRSDYLGDCAEFRELPETLNDCQYLVPRMTREQRKEAIEGPLGRVEIAPALVQRLLNDAGDEPDQLPVLQHALMRTWSHWRAADPDRTRRIELQDYQAIGGLDGALDQHADELLAGAPVDITATIFKRLTARGRSRRERRNPARLAELMAVCGAEGPDRSARVLGVLERFRQGEATFLTPRDGPLTADTYIDITHESLIRQWKKLRDEWLPEERASAKTFLELVDRARAWKNKQGELLFGLDLSNALRWASERNPTSAWAEHYTGPSALEEVLGFIRASDERRLADLERRRRQRLTTRLIAGTLIATGIVGAFYYQYATARAARENALAARLRSVPSVRDPLTRALLLAELADHARPEHLTTYQEAATTAIPVAVLPYRQDSGSVGAGFLGDGRIAVALADGSLLSWRGDGRGDPTVAVIPIDRPAGGDTASILPLTAAVFSHDGRSIAAGLANGAVWFGRTDGKASPPPTADAAGGPGGPALVTALAFSRDGRQLAAGYGDYTARVWPLESTRDGLLTTAPVALPPAHTGPITSIGFDPAGTRLVTGSLDGTTRIWNLAEPASPGALIDSNGDQVTSVAFSPDGTWVFSGHRSGAVRLSQSDGQDGSGELAENRHAAAVTFAAFSPDGSRLVTTSEDRTAQIWMVATRTASREHQPGPPKVMIPTAVLTHLAAVTAAAFSRDGTRVATWSADGAARLWRSEPGEPRVLGLHTLRVESVAFSDDARQVVSASDDGTARIWSLDKRTRRVLAGHSNWVRGAAFSPAGGHKVVTASDDGTVRFWDLAAPGKHRVSPELDAVFSADFNREGTRLVTAVKDNTARIWRVSGLDLEGPPLELRHDDWVRSAAFSPDGSRVVTATTNGEVRVWAVGPGTGGSGELLRLPHQTIVYSAAFSPDGSTIVTAGGDGLARVWPLAASAPSVLLRHESDVYTAAFSAAGDSIVTASRDGTAVVWNAKEGSERLVLQNGTVPVRSASFSPLGNEVVTGDSSGVVRVWRTELRDLRDYVVSLATTSTSCLPATVRTRFLEESEEQAQRHFEHCERENDRTPARAP